MKLMLCTLCLNEMEWLPKLYEQHKDWPDVVSWVFVEAADEVYARTSPDMVSNEGLSVDGTSSFLSELASSGNPNVTYIPHGFSTHQRDMAQGKCEARNRYLEVADYVKPDFILVLDADEFYCRKDQERINQIFSASALRYNAFIFRWRSIWRPPSVADQPLFSQEVLGQVWSVPSCRGWRWSEGIRYSLNHNTPTMLGGISLGDGNRFMRYDQLTPHSYDLGQFPQCIHLGFTASLKTRAAKHRYYEARGEGTTDHRGKFVDCRRAFETWEPGQTLPHGAKVVPYDGPIPECFQ